MEQSSKSILETILKKIKEIDSVRNVTIIDLNGEVIISYPKMTEEFEASIKFFKELGFLGHEFRNKGPVKNLKQLIFNFLNYQIILSLLQNEKFLITFMDKDENINLILKELEKLINEIDEFFNNIEHMEKFHLKKLDERINKLEKYLEIISPPKFKDIKKLIEYIS